MVFEKVKSIIVRQLNVKEGAVKRETDIAADLKADSLDVVEMLMQLEEEFKISLPEDVAVKFKTVGDISDYIEKNKK